MSVITINNDSFNGYLARRTANSQVKYKYFSLTKKVGTSFVVVSRAEQRAILAEAEKYDRELQAWQKAEKAKAKAECKPSKRNNTGVKGIILGAPRDSADLSFMVAIADKKGTAVMRSFNTNRGWRRAWTEACTFLSKTKGVPVEPLLKKIPRKSIAENLG